MAVSSYFQKFEHHNEQNLMEDIVVESIRVYGNDVQYLPRKLNNIDNIFGEDPTASFESSYPVEMYIKNVDGFEGEGTFVSKFGLEIRDQITFTVAQRTFKGLGLTIRPLEGDLIWFPMTQALFEIQFVEHQAMFYQNGKLPIFDLNCERFEYSDESIDTGVASIDKIEQVQSYKETISISNRSAAFTTGETVTGAISLTTAEIVSNAADSMDVINLTGTFATNETITGSTSGSTATIGTVTKEFANDPQAINTSIQLTANGIIDFSEDNPFSEEF